MFGKKKKKDIETINNNNFIPHYSSGRVDNGINQYQYNPKFNSQNANSNLKNQYNPNVNVNPANNQNLNNQYNNSNQNPYTSNQNAPRGYYNYDPQPKVSPTRGGYEQQNNFNPQPGYSYPNNRVPEQGLQPNNGYQPSPTISNDNISNQGRGNETQNFNSRPLNNNYLNESISNGGISPFSGEPKEKNKKAGLFHKNKHAEPIRQQPSKNMNYIMPKKKRDKHPYLNMYKFVLVLILLCLIAYIAIVVLKTIGILA